MNITTARELVGAYPQMDFLVTSNMEHNPSSGSHVVRCSEKSKSKTFRSLKRALKNTPHKVFAL